jgi:F-type H+-transporting ATPase subunit gamma
MPSLIDMRRRIRAVKSTQQITKAMKMVAASKLRRAQERVVATRPFAREARRVLKSVASRVDPSAHELIASRPASPAGATIVIAISADRGLCGSFNTNIIKAVGAFLNERRGRSVKLGLVGRKGRDFLARRGLPVLFEYVNLPKIIHVAEAEAITQPALDEYIAGRADSVYLIYNEFKSVIQQRVVVEQLLPLRTMDLGEDAAAAVDEKPSAEYIYEPSPERILELLLRQLIVAQVLRALVESNAAFYAAQMTAMDAATRNSTEMIESLTLYMNKLRQAAITREIIEVVSGAQAL